MCLGASCRRLFYIIEDVIFIIQKVPHSKYAVRDEFSSRGSTLLNLIINKIRFTSFSTITESPDCFLQPLRGSLQKVLWIRSSQPAASLSGITFPTYSSLHRVFICLIIASKMWLSRSSYRFLPQHFLYFLPEPHGHGSFLPIFFSLRIVVDSFCSL